MAWMIGHDCNKQLMHEECCSGSHSTWPCQKWPGPWIWFRLYMVYTKLQWWLKSFLKPHCRLVSELDCMRTWFYKLKEEPESHLLEKVLFEFLLDFIVILGLRLYQPIESLNAYLWKALEPASTDYCTKRSHGQKFYTRTKSSLPLRYQEISYIQFQHNNWKKY